MHFAGICKNSLIDYPGKISCILFMSGCNFDCPYCHNPDLARNKDKCLSYIDEDGIYDFLEKRKSFLDGVVLTGGEPTLNGELISICEKIKSMGYSVKLDTNGSKPAQIQKLIDGDLLDYIAMDIKTDLSFYNKLIRRDCNPEDILSSISLIMRSNVDYEFRTTCVKKLVDKSIIESIAMLIKGAKKYVLQLFNNVEMLHPEFFNGLDPLYGREDLLCFKGVAMPWVEECLVR